MSTVNEKEIKTNSNEQQGRTERIIFTDHVKGDGGINLFPDGSIEYFGSYYPDKAAKIFWDHVAATAPTNAMELNQLKLEVESLKKQNQDLVEQMEYDTEEYKKAVEDLTTKYSEVSIQLQASRSAHNNDLQFYGEMKSKIDAQMEELEAKNEELRLIAQHEEEKVLAAVNFAREMKQFINRFVPELTKKD